MKQQQLADALDLDVRTLQRYIKRGMPAKPADGETLKQWAERATKWRVDAKKAPGPKPNPAREERERLEIAILEEKLAKLQLQNRVERGELHSRKQCELDEERNYQQVAQALLSVGAQVARKCYQKPPDEIQVIVDDAIRRCLEIIAKGEPASAAARPATRARAT